MSTLENDHENSRPTTPNKDPRIAAAAIALWNAFDYTLPAPPADVARIVIEAADNAKDHRQ
jgi:hypothetical protein